MGIFFVYILKSSVCLTIFYLFYKLLLSRDTFHRFNRIALLSDGHSASGHGFGEFASGGFHENVGGIR